MIGSHDFMGNLIIPIHELAYGNKKTLNLTKPDGYTDKVRGTIKFDYEMEYSNTVTFAKLDEIKFPTPGPIINWLIKEKESGFYTDIRKFTMCKFCLEKFGWLDIKSLDYLRRNDFFPSLDSTEDGESLLSYLVKNYNSNYNASIAWLLMHGESPLKEFPDGTGKNVFDLPISSEIPAIQKWKELNIDLYKEYEDNNTSNYNFDEDKKLLQKINLLCVENKFSDVWEIYLSKLNDSSVPKLSMVLYYLNYLISLHENIPDHVELPCSIANARTSVASSSGKTYLCYIDIFNELIKEENNQLAKSRFELQKLILQILIKNDIVNVIDTFNQFITKHNKLAVAFGFAANFHIDPHLSEFMSTAHNYRIGDEIFDDYLLIPLRNDMEKANEIALQGAALGSGWCEYIIGLYEKTSKITDGKYHDHFVKAVELGYPEAKIHFYFKLLRDLGETGSYDMTSLHQLLEGIISSKNQFEKTRNRARFLRGFYTKREVKFEFFDFSYIEEAARNGIRIANDYVAFKKYYSYCNDVKSGKSGNIALVKRYVSPLASYGDFSAMVIHSLCMMVDVANVASDLPKINKWLSRAEYIHSKIPANALVLSFMFETSFNQLKYSGNSLIQMNCTLVESEARDEKATVSGIAYGNKYPFKKFNIDGKFYPPICNLTEQDSLGVPAFYENYYTYNDNERYLIQHWRSK